MKLTFVLVLIALLCNFSFAQSNGFLSSNIEDSNLLSSLENFENGENEFSEESQEGLILSEEDILENEIETNEEYIFLTESEINGNSDIEMMLYYSTQYIIQEGINKKILLPDTFYFISEVYRIGVQVNNKENYIVNLQISDDKNNTAKANYLVSYQADLGTANVTSYSLTDLSGDGGVVIEVPDNNSTVPDNNNGTVSEDFIPLDLNEVGNNATILMIGVTGIDDVVFQAIQDGLIPQGYYEPTAIYNVAVQTVDNGENFLWDVQVSDYDGNSAELIFIAFFNPITYGVEVLKHQVLNVVRV